MRVVELQNLERKDVQIFYIRKYTATAVLDLTARTANVDIDFTIEMDPLGCKNFSLDIKSTTLLFQSENQYSTILQN